jgi:hypothetical protein
MRGAIERLREAIAGSGSNKAATNAMANSPKPSRAWSITCEPNSR